MRSRRRPAARTASRSRSTSLPPCVLNRRVVSAALHTRSVPIGAGGEVLAQPQAPTPDLETASLTRGPAPDVAVARHPASARRRGFSTQPIDVVAHLRAATRERALVVRGGAASVIGERLGSAAGGLVGRRRVARAAPDHESEGERKTDRELLLHGAHFERLVCAPFGNRPAQPRPGLPP